MIKKCLGCGAVMQVENPNQEGYIREMNYEHSMICERCFRIKHYNEYKLITKNNDEFISILKEINATHDLVVLVVDIFNLSKDIELISRFLTNDLLLVLTKRELLPKSIKDEKLLEYMNQFDMNVKKSIVVSSFKNYHLDELMNTIRKYQKGKDVYFVGLTNAGKSTLINKLIYNYSDGTSMITTSMLPSTTIQNIEIVLDEQLTLVDTPGLLDDGNMVGLVDMKTLKKITPKSEIKPITYQIKVDQTIFIEDFVRLDIKAYNNITIYKANTVRMERVYRDMDKLKNLERHVLSVFDDEDIVISGLGFIHVAKETTVELYTIPGVFVYTRPSLV